MATLQEINAKRKELMGTGQFANEKEAAVAARNQLTPAPTGAGATPTPPTPSPTLATNQAQLAENQAKRQEMIQSGSVPAPTTAPTPTPAPIPATPTPAPVAPTPKPEKMEAPIDYTQAKGREQDIVNNLNTFKTQGMTPEQIVKASDYANASPEKKALIEPYLKSIQPTASSLYNIIASKQEVPLEQKNSSAYRVANNRYQRVNQYVGMTPTEVNQAFTDGKIIEGSETWEDLKTLNPKLAQDALNLRKVNGNKTNIFTYVNNPDGTPVKVNKLEQNFADQYNEDHPDIVALLKSVYDTPTYAEMQAQINTPEVISAQDKASAIETEMNSLQTAMDSVDKDVEKEMLGTGATGSRIALEKSVRKADLQKQYDAKLREYTTAYNKATNLINQNTEMFKYAQEQNKTMQNALAGVYNAQYQAQLGLQTKGAEMQMESDFAKKKAAEALNDPATAITNMMEEYKKLGIPFSESIQTKVATANDFIANGGTLAGYLDKMQKDIQAKPEFQRYQALQQGQLSDREKLSASQSFDLKKMGMEQNFQMQIAQAKQTTNNKWTKLDDGMYTNEAGEIITADELKSAKLMGNSYITKPAGAEGGDCGFYASRGTGMSATPGGNSKEARIQAFSDKTPQVGGMAFFGGAGYDPTYGHISIVTGVNPDGTITVKESNYGNDQKVTERTVPANTATGYYNNTPLAQSINAGTQGTTGQYTDQNINDLAYLVELQEKNPTQAAKDMKELGYSARDLANYKAGNIPLTEKQKNTSKEVMNAIKDLVDPDKYEWNDAVGKFDPKRLIGTQDAEDATIAINNLVAKLTLPNLGVLKGPMSDKDIQFIKEASSKLATTQSNDSFERNLIDAYNLSARRAGMQEITKLSDISTGTKKGTVGGELNYSKYE